jgi:hypothetical protein
VNDEPKDRGPEGDICRLELKVQELKADPYDLEEYADCLMRLVEAARMAGFSLEDLNVALQVKKGGTMRDDKCHGCDGRGWVQVIDPPVYQHKDAGNTAPVPPYYTSRGTARAVICPLCKGTGRRKENDP